VDAVVVVTETGVMIATVAAEADPAVAAAVVVDGTDVAAAAEAALGVIKSPKPSFGNNLSDLKTPLIKARSFVF